MPTLILLRHAKSDWTTGDDDRRRPLATRGRRAAAVLGKFLSHVAHVPDLAITSPAERAVSTLRLAMDAGDWSCPVREVAALYDGGVDDLIRELRSIDGSVSVLLAVGHEPTWSDAVSMLTGGSEVRMPTAAAARIDFDHITWPQVGAGAGLLSWLVTPRLLQ